MSDVQFVVNVIVYDDGHFDVIYDSSVADETCLQVLEQAHKDMAEHLGTKPPQPPTIKRLK